MLEDMKFKKIGTTYIDVDKARDFETASGSVTRFDVGSFVNVLMFLIYQTLTLYLEREF